MPPADGPDVDHAVALRGAWPRFVAGGAGTALLRAVAARIVTVFQTPVERAAGATRTSRSGALDLATLAVAVLAGTALRVVALGRVGLNSDEAVYAGQAASLTGNPHFSGNFPVIRAHPLLYQLIVSPLYRAGVPDVPGRYVGAAFGVATIVLVFHLGRLLYGGHTGAIAALLLAVTPYHVVVTRQELLDGPMTFFATAALVCLAAAGTGRSRFMVAAGACLGLAALTKETAVILVAASFVFVSLTPRLWRPTRHLVGGAVAALALSLMYPLITAVSGGSRTGQSYLLWQLTRRPNHDFGFYLTIVAGSIGWLLIAAAAAGLFLLRHRASWRERLLLSWVVVPLVFFEVWPVKGYSYLLLLVPPIAVLGARALASLVEHPPRRLPARAPFALVTAAVVASLLVPSVRGLVEPASSGLAGAGGTPGGREAGRWVAAHVPQGARLMTIGPSMANVLQYYSSRPADGLSVSPSPAHRNPSYQPIRNPDLALRSGDYQYAVWDAFSAQRSETFAAKQRELIRRYHGLAVHTERAALNGKADQPVIVIYELHP